MRRCFWSWKADEYHDGTDKQCVKQQRRSCESHLGPAHDSRGVLQCCTGAVICGHSGVQWRFGRGTSRGHSCCECHLGCDTPAGLGEEIRLYHQSELQLIQQPWSTSFRAGGTASRYSDRSRHDPSSLHAFSWGSQSPCQHTIYVYLISWSICFTGPPSPILTVNSTVGLDSTLVLVWKLPNDGGSPIVRVVVEAFSQGTLIYLWITWRVVPCAEYSDGTCVCAIDSSLSVAQWHCVMVSLWQIVCFCDRLSLSSCHYDCVSMFCVILVNTSQFIMIISASLCCCYSLWRFVTVCDGLWLWSCHSSECCGDLDGLPHYESHGVCCMSLLPPHRCRLEHRCQLVVLCHRTLNIQCVRHWLQPLQSGGLQLNWVLVGE